MKTVSAAKVAAHFDEYLEASRDQAVLVTRNGKPVAVLLAVQDKAEAKQLARSRPRSLRSVFMGAHEQLEKDGGIPRDQFWHEIEQSRDAKRPPASRRKKA
jgi:prevent-host-death family protein